MGPVGDTAVVIELGRTIDPAINARVLALDRALSAAALGGVIETVPTYRSLLVHYDPWAVGYGELAAELRRVVETAPREGEEAAGVAAHRSAGQEFAAPVAIPVAYGGDDGPDLGEVARHAGLSEEEVVRRHAAGEYRVAMLGFAPGFAYLMGMDPTIAMARLDTPRIRVPAGSLSIADGQTGIYPFAMPGGWRLIGRTALPLFDPRRDPPATLAPGARVRFVRVRAAELPALGGTNQADSATRDPRDGPPEGGRAIRVVEPGILASVQDEGRRGYQRFGVPPSGAADGPALAEGNLAVGNDPNAAAIEITAGGAEFEFLTSAIFALGGAEMKLTLDGQQVDRGKALRAQAGARLRVGLPREGFRGYLCLDGGIAVPGLLGSRSTYLPGGFGGHEGRALRPGDVLQLGAPTADHRASFAGARTASPPAGPGPAGGAVRIGRRIELPFVPGGQWDDFPEETRRSFARRSWRVSHRSDRMGLRLEGEPLETGGAGLAFVSDGTVTGAIQVSGDGLPIVLFVDRQTTGGYPKLGAVASVALPLIAQAHAGVEFVFRPVSVEDAAEALRASAGR